MPVFSNQPGSWLALQYVCIEQRSSAFLFVVLQYNLILNQPKTSQGKVKQHFHFLMCGVPHTFFFGLSFGLPVKCVHPPFRHQPDAVCLVSAADEKQNRGAKFIYSCFNFLFTMVVKDV